MVFQEPITLASRSPRRRDILHELGIPFNIVPSCYEENNGRPLEPEELVRLQAEGKARDVYTKVGGIVLGADTVVVLAGDVLGKPKDAADARRMLRSLSGRTHYVLTGVAVMTQGHMQSGVDATAVTFRRLSEKDIEEYVQGGEPMDKAGAYAIQGTGQRFVTAIEGSFSNVVGLPKKLTIELLENVCGTR